MSMSKDEVPDNLKKSKSAGLNLLRGFRDSAISSDDAELAKNEPFFLAFDENQKALQSLKRSGLKDVMSDPVTRNEFIMRVAAEVAFSIVMLELESWHERN